MYILPRAAKKGYTAIIIDPIYKVITGDENSADQMAKFCNQFDMVCTELNCAVIYCHHHSKGTQGQKRSMDRASGSGVFARDPDAMLDLIELEVTDALQKQEENKAVCAVCGTYLDKHYPGEEKVSQDDMCSEKAMLETCSKFLKPDVYKSLLSDVASAREKVKHRTAWRIEATLREFEKPPMVNLWFDYPVHHVDDIGSLKDIDAEGEAPPWQKAADKRKTNAKKAKKSKKEEFEFAYQAANFGEPPTIEALCEALNLSKRSVEGRMKEYGYISIKGKVRQADELEKSPQEP